MDLRTRPGYRPATEPSEFPFTAVISLEDVEGGGTKYTALAIHGDAEVAKRHREMGFHEGWGAALDQLVELVR